MSTVERNWEFEFDRLRAQLSPGDLAELASCLGVAVRSVERLPLGIARRADLDRLAVWRRNERPEQAWVFAERDAEARVVGLQLRAPDGRKRNVGSRGLFYAQRIENSQHTLVVEGASDVIASATLGVQAVGRPSNTGGSGLLIELLRNHPSSIVLGENDQKPDGKFPGRDGMLSVGRQLATAWNRPVDCSLPPQHAKDVRDWLRQLVDAGLNPADREACDLAGFELLAALRDSRTTTEPTTPPPPHTVAWTPFPTASLPSPLTRFIRDTSKSIDCDESMVALAVIVACAGQIGNARCVRVKRGYTQPSVVWGAIVAGSGSAKSPALNAAFAPIREAELRHGEQHARARRRYELDLEAYNENKRRSRRDTGADEPGARPDEPRRERRLLDDLTLEGLRSALVDSPRGVTCCRDELAGWLDSFDSYRDGHGGDVSRWLSIFDASSLLVLRADASRCADVPRAAVSLVGGIQGGVARRRFTRENVENGLLARLLIVAPPRRAQRWSDFEVSAAVNEEYSRILTGLGSLRWPDAVPGESPPAPIEIALAPESLALFREFCNEVGEHVMTVDEDEGANWSKLRSYAARLALVDHLVRFVTGEVGDELTLTAHSMSTGIELARWFGREAERLLGALTQSPEERNIQEDVAWIAREGGAVSPRDVVSRGPRPRPSTMEAAESRLRRLEQAGLGSLHRKQGRRGPTALVFRLHGGSGSRFGADEPGAPDSAAASGAVRPASPAERASRHVEQPSGPTTPGGHGGRVNGHGHVGEPTGDREPNRAGGLA